uniref:Predicted protein n=1 Tax=Hordeum vulgare subsp. vulgare TaxID=112509 RepID=F2E9K1_HORVV|nr:predicted protein [Hordeum vulgare subsp. vulgare]
MALPVASRAGAAIARGGLGLAWAGAGAATTNGLSAATLSVFFAR